MTTTSQMAFGLLKLRSTHSSRSPLTNREHTAIREVFSYWLVQGQGVAGSEMSARAVQVASFSLRSNDGIATETCDIHPFPPRQLSLRTTASPSGWGEGTGNFTMVSLASVTPVRREAGGKGERGKGGF